jgi:hypothetical protein
MKYDNIIEEIAEYLSVIENKASFDEEVDEHDFIRKFAAIRGYLAKIEVKKDVIEGVFEGNKNFEIFSDNFENIAELAYEEQYSPEFDSPEENLKQILKSAKKARKSLAKEL